MSYFINNVVYVIVPDAEISNEMINAVKISFNANGSTMRKTVAGAAVPSTLFKTKTPIIPVFNGYEWLNSEDAKELMKTPDWALDVFNG